MKKINDIGICSECYKRWGKDRYKKIKEHGYSHIDFGMIDTDAPLYLYEDGEFQTRLMYEKNLLTRQK